MARSLDAIVQELDASYNPSRQLINSRIDAIPGQGDAEIAGLKATQDQAFGDIVNGARDRGVAFGGIPLAEQAKYTAGTFLPAVAKVRQSQNDTKTSLLDALNGLNLDQRKYAQSVQSGELASDEQKRQFDEQAALSRASAAANAPFDFSKLLATGPSPTAAPPPQKAAGNTPEQAAYDFVRSIGKKGDSAVISDFNAAKAYYQKTGNPNDLLKLQFYKQLYPNLLGTATWKQPLSY